MKHLRPTHLEQGEFRYPPRPTTIGVVIPTLNAGGRLRRTLDALATSEPRPKILVVDSSSTDGTAQLARNAGAEVISVCASAFNHGSTREMARKALSTSVVVMLTQDAEPACDELVPKLVAPIVSGSAVVAYGRQLPRPGAGLIESFAREFSYPAVSHTRGIEDLPSLGAQTFFCSNSCAAYANSALDQVGGFPHVLIAEDTLVVARLLERGGRVAYVADATVWHSHNHTLTQEFRRHFDTGYMRAGHPETFRVGRDQERGSLYTKLLLAQILRKAPWMVPYAGAHLAAKSAGYYLGRLGSNLPRPVCRCLSGNQSYWREVSSP